MIIVDHLCNADAKRHHVFVIWTRQQDVTQSFDCRSSNATFSYNSDMVGDLGWDITFVIYDYFQGVEVSFEFLIGDNRGISNGYSHSQVPFDIVDIRHHDDWTHWSRYGCFLSLNLLHAQLHVNLHFIYVPLMHILNNLHS